MVALPLQVSPASTPITVSSIRTNPNHALVIASGCNDLDAMQRALDNGADINTTDSAGAATPLICAAFGGKIEAVQFLISKKANLNLRDSTGNTALMYAVTTGSEVAIALVKAGADVHMKDNMGRTALMNATDPSIRKLLNDAGAKEIKWTPPWAATPSPSASPSSTPPSKVDFSANTAGSVPVASVTPSVAPKDALAASPARFILKTAAQSSLIWLYSLAAIIVASVGVVVYRSRRR